ncbi:MAG: hypothetical protein K5682_02190, partial [Lachnospiraceae bacterium]|nr:hypothetical protein [Lachnospiraceae bacterium]
MAKRIEVTGKSVFFWNGIRRGLMVLLLVQIAFGIVWMILHMGTMPAFAESDGIIASATHFTVNEYQGILYVGLCALLIRLGNLLPIPWYSILYVIQLCFSFIAFYYFLWALAGKKYGRNISRRTFRIFFILTLMTIPRLLHVSMAVLPYSMSFSLLLILGGMLLQRRNAILLAGCCLLGGLMRPGNLILFCVFTGISVLYFVFHDKEREDLKMRMLHMGVRFLAILIVLVLTYGITVAVREENDGLMQNNVYGAMLSRLAWPSFSETYFFMPPELQEVLTEDVINATKTRADDVYTVVGPLIEQAFGRKEAAGYYRQLAMLALNNNTKVVLREWGSDLLAYLFIPLSEMEFTYGVSHRAYGYLLGQFLGNGRLNTTMGTLSYYLSLWYVRFSQVLFLIIILLGICNLIMKIRRGQLVRRHEGRNLNRFFILVTVLGVITAGTSSHMPVNGLYVLPVYVFWYCLLLHVIYHQGR